MTDLEKKECQAIDLIRSASSQHEYVVSYSGGKDSQVLLHLFKLAKVSYQIIYKNTTIDPPGTLGFVTRNGATILEPRRTFFELIRKKGLPSFSRRFCCTELKEGYISKYLSLGIRAAESQSRNERYNAPEACRKYTKTKVTCQLLPLVFWSENDISDYIINAGVNCHPLYYDEKGVFHAERRLGCMGCPLPWDRSKDDFYQYPKLVKLWCRNLDVFRKTHPNSSACTLFSNAYEQFAHNLFYHDYNKFKLTTTGFFPVDWREKLSELFNIKL